MVCLSPVGYGDKQRLIWYVCRLWDMATNIPYQSLLIKPMFSILAHTEKQFFFKTSLPGKVIALE